MKEIKLYYSSDIQEPWCDLQEVRNLLSSLKEKGVSVEEVDTAWLPERKVKEFYTSSVILPSIKKKYKISGVFGTRTSAGSFFGKEQPGLVVFEDGEVLDVYPHDENGRRMTIADFLKEKIAELK
jgi:hypothetical protein